MRTPRPASGGASTAISRALREFLATEVAGGVVLLAATVVALVWANSPWQESYDALWHTTAIVGVGRWVLELDLAHWVNDGLMAIFFLVVGLEVKREFLQGELRERRKAVLPVVAAIGGMALPALLYVVVNAGGPGAPGWGIPMATDIAFALGVLAVVAPKVPSGVRVFLLALAIVDDIGAIVVIAIFYSSSIDLVYLGTAVAIVLLIVGLRRVGVAGTPVFVLLGVCLWLAVHASGIHATIAGVVMGLLAPATARLTHEIDESRDRFLDLSTPAAAWESSIMAKRSVSELEWLEHMLHPISSFVIVPVFALANAGVSLAADDLERATTSRIAIGIVVGLVVGKAVGITAAAWLATRLGVAELPPGARWSQMVGVATLAGIGFTVSLFITDLAFEDQLLVGEAKIGILAASVAATAVGAVVLRRASRDSVAAPDVELVAP